MSATSRHRIVDAGRVPCPHGGMVDVDQCLHCDELDHVDSTGATVTEVVCRERGGNPARAIGLYAG